MNASSTGVYHYYWEMAYSYHGDFFGRRIANDNVSSFPDLSYRETCGPGRRSNAHIVQSRKVTIPAHLDSSPSLQQVAAHLQLCVPVVEDEDVGMIVCLFIFLNYCFLFPPPGFRRAPDKALH